MGAVRIPVDHGWLEGLLSRVEVPRAAVLVCHPHPLYGGTMHSHIAYRIADAFRQAEVTALRFNFRGVGLSTGAHDAGRGEVDDAQAALGFLQEQEPRAPLYVAGFSFGARVALQLAWRDARVVKALAVGLPVDVMDCDFVEQLGKPKAFVHASEDEYGAFRRVQGLVERAPPPKALFVVPEANHACTGRLGDLSRAVGEAVAWLLQAE